MKRETLRHPKTYDLAARLNCSRAQALGYLTLLWDFTADYAIGGDIGRVPDGAIARGCDWEGDPSEFVNALVDARWLDRDPGHRLLIHNWADHCERWVRAKIEKTGQAFAVPTIETTVVATVVATIEPSPPRDQTEPNQSKPNRTKPKAADADEVVVIPPGLEQHAGFLDAWNAWLADRRDRRLSTRPKHLREQLAFLDGLGPLKAVESLRNTVRNAWQGLFDPGEKRGRQAPIPPAAHKFTGPEPERL